jgi:hypothetical protein
MGIHGLASKGSVAVVSCLFILLVLHGASCQGADTKTAYTRDGINFVSKERVDENIRFEYAKPGDYREVQVPLATAVVNASVIPDIVSDDTQEEASTEKTGPSNSSQKAAAPGPDEREKYPYASIGIALLIVGGAIVFVASGIYGQGRQ